MATGEPPARIEPGPGQESVWDYPRPPSLVPTVKRLRVEVAGVIVADTVRGIKVCETSQPPAYYFPPEDVDEQLVVPSLTRTFCEWKGTASYWTIVVGGRQVVDAAWSYPSPSAHFVPITDFLSFYPGRVDACFVDDERVQPMDGDFYGGWVTADIVGPFKGAPGTLHW